VIGSFFSGNNINLETVIQNNNNTSRIENNRKFSGCLDIFINSILVFPKNKMYTIYPQCASNKSACRGILKKKSTRNYALRYLPRVEPLALRAIGDQ